MENFDNYTNSELLTMLLDGELDAANEAELFRSLADNPELQQQMEYQLAMKEAVKNDTEAFTPPIDTTTGLFNKLGYAVPAGIPAVSAFWNSIFNRRAVATAALLLVGALSVTGIVLTNNDSDVASNRNISIVDTESGNNLDNNELLAVNHVDNGNTSLTDKSKVPVVKSSSAKVEKSENKVFSAKSESENKEFNNIADPDFAKRNIYSAKIIFENPGLNYSKNSKYDILRSGIASTPYNYSNIDIDRKNSVYIRSIFNSGSFPMDNGFNNIAIGWLRSWKQDFSFGVELGSQSISRLFTDDLSNQLVTESTNVLFGTLNLRYEANSINVAGITPFAQVRFGFGTDFNYMAGGNLGLIWSNETLPFAVSSSYNLTNFQYNHLNNSYNFNTNDFNIGFHYKF
jgi:hypothetical protein